MKWKNIGENFETSCHCAQECSEWIKSSKIQSIFELTLTF